MIEAGVRTVTQGAGVVPPGIVPRLDKAIRRNIWWAIPMSFIAMLNRTMTDAGSGPLRAFRHMCRLESQCTCAPRDWDGEYWKHEQCKACAEWWKQNSILHDALKLRPGNGRRLKTRR
jgi:hypothetical protein